MASGQGGFRKGMTSGQYGARGRARLAGENDFREGHDFSRAASGEERLGFSRCGLLFQPAAPFFLM
jgi:hypothetical protein